MLYLFHGSDVEKVRSKAFEWIAKARAKEPNLAYVRLSKEEVTPSALLEAASAGGLFVQRLLVLIDDPFVTRGTEDEEEGTDASPKNLVEEQLDLLAASDNAIVILAPKLTAPKVKKLAAKAKMVYPFDLRTPKVTRGFNVNLANALAGRDREKLWLETMRALRAGDAPEAVHGLLHWKARDLMQKGSRAWSPKESRKLSLDLIALVQESRRGGLPLATALERFALTV